MQYNYCMQYICRFIDDICRLIFNSFSAKGNIQVFANNTDSLRADSPEISIVCLLVIKIVQTVITWEMEMPDFEHGRVYFKQFGAKRFKDYLTSTEDSTYFCFGFSLKQNVGFFPLNIISYQVIGTIGEIDWLIW